MSNLLFLDIRGIKNYVDNRSYLFEIRASSKKLENAMKKTAEYIIDKYNFKEIFVGGGNALLEGGSAEYDSTSIREFFLEKLGLPKDTIAPDLSIGFNKIGDLVALRTKLSVKKRAFHTKVLPSKLNTKLVCSSCDERGGKNIVKYEQDDKERKLCDFCSELRKEGKKIFEKSLKSLIKKYNSPLTIEKIAKKQLEFIAGDDLDTEGKSDSRRRMAIVLIDGNLFGEYFTSIADYKDLAEISSKIDSKMKSIFDEEIEHISKFNPIDAMRVELGRIYIGGDDMKLFLPSRIAIPFTYNVIKKFSKWAKQELKADLALSAGIFVTKPKVNLSSTYDIADYLLKQAKIIYNKKYFGSMDIHLGLTQIHRKSLIAYRSESTDQKKYSLGINYGDDFWSTLIRVIPELETYNMPANKELKSSYLQPWRTINQRIVQQGQGVNDAILFCAYMLKRSEKDRRGTYKGYRTALDLLKLGKLNYLERAIEIVKIRCEL